MRGTLNNKKLSFFAFAGNLVDKAVGVVDASAPVAIPVLERFGLADSRVPIALNILNERVDPLQSLLVFKLPARVFVPSAGRKDDLHKETPYASISSWTLPSPRSKERMDSLSTRWFASDQKGSGDSAIMSKGIRRRITTCLRKRRTALDISSPAPLKNPSASLRRSESTRICNVEVAILKSFVVCLSCIIPQNNYTLQVEIHAF